MMTHLYNNSLLSTVRIVHLCKLRCPMDTRMMMTTMTFFCRNIAWSAPRYEWKVRRWNLGGEFLHISEVSEISEVSKIGEVSKVSVLRDVWAIRKNWEDRWEYFGRICLECEIRIENKSCHASNERGGKFVQWRGGFIDNLQLKILKVQLGLI